LKPSKIGFRPKTIELCILDLKTKLLVSSSARWFYFNSLNELVKRFEQLRRSKTSQNEKLTLGTKYLKGTQD
jgi:hypothetical protein